MLTAHPSSNDKLIELLNRFRIYIPIINCVWCVRVCLYCVFQVLSLLIPLWHRVCGFLVFILVNKCKPKLNFFINCSKTLIGCFLAEGKNKKSDNKNMDKHKQSTADNITQIHTDTQAFHLSTCYYYFIQQPSLTHRLSLTQARLLQTYITLKVDIRKIMKKQKSKFHTDIASERRKNPTTSDTLTTALRLCVRDNTSHHNTTHCVCR